MGKVTELINVAITEIEKISISCDYIKSINASVITEIEDAKDYCAISAERLCTLLCLAIEIVCDNERRTTRIMSVIDALDDEIRKSAHALGVKSASGKCVKDSSSDISISQRQEICQG